MPFAQNWVGWRITVDKGLDLFNANREQTHAYKGSLPAT